MMIYNKDEETGELYHYGIQGQKWGIRRFQNEDGTYTEEGLKRLKEVTSYGTLGGTIKKGTELYRVQAIDGTDKTYDNKKYVSTSKMDHAKWEDYLVNSYKDIGDKVFEVTYKTTKDIKVASLPDLEKSVIKIFDKDPSIFDTNVSEIERIIPNASKKADLTIPNMFGSYSMAAQTNFGKQVVQDLLDSGYDAVVDTHGWNVSSDPLIILDPDKKLMKTSIKEYK